MSTLIHILMPLIIAMAYGTSHLNMSAWRNDCYRPAKLSVVGLAKKIIVRDGSEYVDDGATLVNFIHGEESRL